jgi:energy-coupling factor transport system permease protein
LRKWPGETLEAGRGTLFSLRTLPVEGRPVLLLRDGEVRLSTTLKISLYVIFIVALFFVRSISLQAFIAAAVSIVVLFVVPPRKIRGGIIPIMVFLLFTFAGNLFFHSGRIIYRFALLSVTDEGLVLAGIRTLRVFSMIFAAKLLTSVLSVDEMIRSLGSMLRPLERLGLPVKDFVSVLGLTMKFFPALMAGLLKEYAEHMKNVEIRGFRRRVRHMVSFLMPVFVRSIRSPESFFVSEAGGADLKAER